MNLFDKPGDFAAFIKLIEQARRRTPSIAIFGYVLMTNHWHLVLQATGDGKDLSKFMAWLSGTHVRRWREHRGSVGQGHLYQGRFKSFLIQEDEHLLSVVRYVLANPLRAGMVQRAQDWLWSSLVNAAGADNFRIQLTPLPVDRPRNWLAMVNEPQGESVVERIRTSIQRDRPYGDEQWTARIVKAHGWQSTLRDPWRPKRQSIPAP
jgi:putative transposase